MGIPIYVFLTILFWDWIPVRIVAFCFFLIWLDLFFKARKWDKEDKEKEKRTALSAVRFSFALSEFSK